MTPIITKHVMERYCERIRNVGLYNARAEIRHCLMGAKPKHMRRVMAGKRCVYIPTGCCLFICERGKLVTVLARKEPAP